MSKWICVVELPGGNLVAITKSNEDDNHLATWPSERAAEEATADMMLVQAHGANYLEVA